MHRLAHVLAAAIGLTLTACENSPAAPDDAGASSSVPVAATVGRRTSFTFTVDNACSSQFPEALRQRSYSAEPFYSSNVFTLGDAVFESSSGLMWNIVYRSATDASSAWWFQDPPIWERLSRDAYLLIYGASEYRSSSPYGEWPFWGSVTYCSKRKSDSLPACAVPEISCESNSHRLRVTQN